MSRKYIVQKVGSLRVRSWFSEMEAAIEYMTEISNRYKTIAYQLCSIADSDPLMLMKNGIKYPRMDVFNELR